MERVDGVERVDKRDVGVVRRVRRSPIEFRTVPQWTRTHVSFVGSDDYKV